MAVQTNCTEGQVQNYFAKLRGNLRNFLLRLQRSAAAPVAAIPSALPGEPARGVGDAAASHDASKGQPGNGEMLVAQIPLSLFVAPPT